MNQLEKRIAFCLSSIKDMEVLGGHDTWARDMNNEEVIKDLAERFDPTEKGLYLSWLVKCYKNQQFLLSDDVRVESSLNLFDANKKHLPAEQRDINRVKSIEDLRTLLTPFMESMPVLSNRKMKAEAKVRGATLVLQSEIGRLLEIKEYEAAKIYGMGTQWCTTSSERHYENYQDGLYVLLLSDGRKYQFHDRTSSFMDENDHQRKLEHIAEGAREFVKLALFHTASVNLIRQERELSLDLQEHPNLKGGAFRILEGSSQHSAECLFRALKGVDEEFILEANARIPTDRKGILLSSPACPASIVYECLNSDIDGNVEAALAHPACDVTRAIETVRKEGAVLALSRNPRIPVESYGAIMLRAKEFGQKALGKASFNLSRADNVATIKAAISKKELWSVLPKGFLNTPKEVLLHISKQPHIDLPTRQGLVDNKSINLSELGSMNMEGVKIDLSVISTTKEMTEELYKMVIDSGARLEILRAMDKRGISTAAADILVQRGYAQTVAFHEKTPNDVAVRVFPHLDHEDQGTLLLRRPLTKECASTYLEASTNGKRALQVVMNPGVSLPERAELLELLYRRRAEFEFDTPTAGAVRDAASRIKQEINPSNKRGLGM